MQLKLKTLEKDYNERKNSNNITVSFFILLLEKIKDNRLGEDKTNLLKNIIEDILNEKRINNINEEVKCGKNKITLFEYFYYYSEYDANAYICDYMNDFKSLFYKNYIQDVKFTNEKIITLKENIIDSLSYLDDDLFEKEKKLFFFLAEKYDKNHNEEFDYNIFGVLFQKNKRKLVEFLFECIEKGYFKEEDLYQRKDSFNHSPNIISYFIEIQENKNILDFSDSNCYFMRKLDSYFNIDYEQVSVSNLSEKAENYIKIKKEQSALKKEIKNSNAIKMKKL